MISGPENHWALVSAGHCWEPVEIHGCVYFAECFAWTFIQLGSDLPELACCEGSEVGAAGQALPEQSVRVLVCAALPV